MPNTAQQSSKKSDWITPRDPYILAVEEVFGGRICLDPASSEIANENVQAQFYFTIDDDGLTQSWYKGDVLYWSAGKGGLAHTDSLLWNVFLNPPYGRLNGDTGPFNLRLWVDKVLGEYRRGSIDEAIVLVNAFPGAKWFRELWKCPICFVDHRIKFVDPATGEQVPDPTQYNAFVYMGPNFAKFWKVFYRFGPVVRAMDDPEIPSWVVADGVRI